MSDRSSAQIFGTIFKLLADDPTDQHRSWARILWKQSYHFDFAPEQMMIDKELLELDLAAEYIHPRNSAEDCIKYFDSECKELLD